jgi:hypothetical protein
MILKQKIEDSIPSRNHQMRVQIGDICCSISCRDGEVFGYLHELYRNFLSECPADIHIELDVVEQFTTQMIDSALSQGKVVGEDYGIVAMYRLPEDEATTMNGAISVTVEKRQFNPRFGFKIMNLLLPPSYYTACSRKHHDGLPAMLVHSCGILRRGQTLLFAGPSEMGKTTIARLCGDEHGHVVNDEMLLISLSGSDSSLLTVQGVPIVGGVAQRLNVKAPLACVLMLKQAQRTSIRSLTRLEAYLRFMRQVIAPRCFNGRPDDTKTMLSRTAEFSDCVTKTVPFYELQFTLDRETLWREVAEVEESLMKGGV